MTPESSTAFCFMFLKIVMVEVQWLMNKATSRLWTGGVTEEVAINFVLYNL